MVFERNFQKRGPSGFSKFKDQASGSGSSNFKGSGSGFSKFKGQASGSGFSKSNEQASGSGGGSGQGQDSSESRIRQSMQNDAIDAKFGFERLKEATERTGWLLNMHTTEVLDEDKRLISGVDYYFIDDQGGRFKTTLAYRPYFYVLAKPGTEKEVAQFLVKKFGGFLNSAEIIAKEDLDLPNHLVGLKQNYLKLSFLTISDLMRVRKDVLPAVRKNKEREKSNTAYAEMLKQSYIGDLMTDGDSKKMGTNHMESIIDIREYDVPYHVRVSIDNKIFVGRWYTVKPTLGGNHQPTITNRPDIIESPDCVVLAYDIETTKLPLKFPDASFDQIMMISYMIDGQGFLITNREIVSADVEDFEYTPRPEFEGLFTIFNEPNEKSLIQKFFDHILQIKPHIFATYNGDFFDWKFVEARATIHEINMLTEIGFSVVRDGVYSCRPCIHMDCFNWVKRDSYLPVGSQNLKAVAKAKLRYDPVELDPEDMCRMASEQPQVLSNYSVSDAVATYYLYMKYVHPFIFALCTIIPMEPDEVLRKGSGTLCESLLMVEAFHARIIFPNKQESILNKMTGDGHVLDQETYVGGHVEALESGVFRADIPCRFRLVPEKFTELMNDVEKALRHAVEEEEKVPMDQVLNLEEVVTDIQGKLAALRDNPIRTENPVIYHLDVGAMYPNIILTNRLQPSAMVHEAICAACDFNKQEATCKRVMAWTWRGEYMPPSRSEFQRIQQQLEMEKFPPLLPGGPQRQFHELNKEDQAAYEKKRLQDYSRKAYRKTHITRIEERYQTVCQQENSFYVDTVRAFRDRRYEYKGMCKTAKQQVSEAVASGDPAKIKSAKNREVLFDSLQLAHKCILNSFYGYVMRKGARWHSMEMAGIVCHTGANIIRKAREIIEKVGRPLELDTDGIWCVLPASFPENFTIKTSSPKRPKITVSYANAVLNIMVKEEFTNKQYHELVDADNLEYEVRHENSIFFEVDGPYLAMILPAAKEEGKKLKKRYAVFNFDKSLAELKGFEVKRRGELQLIKNFQSSVFDAFLKGDSLESCYENVARVADYWLDVLYSKAVDMPDSELFELISENRSMSRKLEDYGAQKSTSISTAKRLAEFLGDQMVKDAGLSCRFIITRKPDGAPVTERAIPLAIFQAEHSVRKHYLRRWLKDNSIEDFDIRVLLDWNYYIERLGGCIQKIVTIPAALQGVSNPVPRVPHPEWLHKRMLEKTDVLKQRKINEIFKSAPKTFPTIDEDDDEDNSEEENDVGDIEDFGQRKSRCSKVIVVNSKRKARDRSPEEDLTKTWREVLGPPPPMGNTAKSISAWVVFHKKKWTFQKKQRTERLKRLRTQDESDDFSFSRNAPNANNDRRAVAPVTLGGFLRRAQRTLIDTPWQIIQLIETGHPGMFKLWALVGTELHQLKLMVPRIFYLNSKEPKLEGEHYRKSTKILPRAQHSLHLYEYSIPEELFRQTCNEIDTDIATNPAIDGIYEAQMPLLFRAIVNLGCVVTVDRQAARTMRDVGDTFELHQLNYRDIGTNNNGLPYIDLNHIKHLYLYHHKCGNKTIVALFIPPSKKVSLFAVDTVRTNQIPNLNSMYNAVRADRIAKGEREDNIMEPDYTFESRVETDPKQVYRYLQRLLQTYKEEKRGPTFIAVQSKIPLPVWTNAVPAMADFPLVPIHVSDVDNLYNVMDWQRVGCSFVIRHFLRIKTVLNVSLNQSKYFHIPVGNLPTDSCLYACDVLYARQLMKNNYILWCSQTEKPDLGGKEADDNRLVTEFEEHNSIVINNPGCYSSVCVELELDGLAVNTLLQAHHVHDIEGTCATVAFDNLPAQSLEEMIGNTPGPSLSSYDETALCSNAFRVLRGMVNAWLRDVSIHRNEQADFQLTTFYRWLRTPHSLLYDPALRKTLNNLMKKLFIQLVAEFMRLGSAVVYGDFSKLIICTKKNRVADAIGYIEYVTTNIKNREFFHTIDIKMRRSWEYLMWLDSANFAGVKGRVPDPASIATNNKSKLSKTVSKYRKRKSKKRKDSDDDSDSEQDSDIEEVEDDDEEEDDDEDREMEMSWALVNYLPDVGNCRSNFQTIVASYILNIHRHLSDEFEGITPGHTPVRRRRGSQTPRRLHNNPLLDNTTDYAKKLVQGELTQSLFLIVQQIDKKYSSYIPPESGTIPTYSFSTREKDKPALQFVKAIHRVLSLDKSIDEEAYKLRRNMLKLIGIGEFSEEAQWRDPCVSLVLPEVICKVCNECRDIDLCKDPNIDISKELPVWRCPTCKTEYDTAEMEVGLVDVVNRKLMAYVLQDLQCKKCHQIKEDNIKVRCVCAGELETVVNTAQTAERLKTFKEIAQHFGMPLLLHNVEWILQMSPHLNK